MSSIFDFALLVFRLFTVSLLGPKSDKRPCYLKTRHFKHISHISTFPQQSQKKGCSALMLLDRRSVFGSLAF